MSNTEFPTGGGWQFRQPQTGWMNPASMIGKDASVDAIRKHRLANPAITAKHKLSTDPVQIAKELVSFQVARGAMRPEQVQPSFFQRRPSNLPGRVEGVAAGIRIAAQGTAVVLDWIQAGGDPVAQGLAEKRASTCAACAKNVEGAWYTTAPAELLRAAIKGWQSLKGSEFLFETKQGDLLKSCDVCKCLMRLKVFCPLEHIVSRTKPEIMASFPESCWIPRKDA